MMAEVDPSVLPLRPDKKTAIELVAYVVPGYIEVLEECRSPLTWRKLTEKFQEITQRLKIENYVHLYEDEKRIGAALLNGVMSADYLAEWTAAMSAATPEEQQEVLRELGRRGGVAEQLADQMFPDDPNAEQEQLSAFEQLTESEKQEAIKHGQFMMMFLFAWLHQALAVMVHGEKMTSLVPKALSGDVEAFGKAVHIDKNLLLHHPGFKELHSRAIRDVDSSFLDMIARRLASPVTKGRQKRPGIFFVFSLLESMNWLDDLRHGEILDICDRAGMERWKNRIEDENALTKALGRYRRYQKTGGVSMH